MGVSIVSVEYYRVHTGMTFADALESGLATDLRDMLRYDHAFIHRDAPGIVAFVTWKDGRRKVKPNITHARWRSFGVRLEAMPDDYHPQAWTSDYANWATRMHPHKGSQYGPMDYSQLVPVTIQDHLDAKSLSAVQDNVIFYPGVHNDYV